MGSQEREAFLTEVATERRRLADAGAEAARQTEEARTQLLQLKGRLAEYEAAAAAALRQAEEQVGTGSPGQWNSVVRVQRDD